MANRVTNRTIIQRSLLDKNTFSALSSLYLHRGTCCRLEHFAYAFAGLGWFGERERKEERKGISEQMLDWTGITKEAEDQLRNSASLPEHSK